MRLRESQRATRNVEFLWPHPTPLIHVIFDERCYDDLNPPSCSVFISGGTKQSMTQIIEMLESGISGLTVSLKSEDLREFAHLLIERAKEQLLPVMVSASHENLLTKKEVLEKFNVCHTTLWNWERKGYLIPVKIGRKVSYRQADIERIIIERGKR